MKNSNDADIRERNLPIALHHARIIQEQKDVQSAILESIETLIDFPTSPNADPAQPSSQDLTALRTHLAHFQVSDYEAVIEERNAVHKCGYVLCPRPYESRSGDGRSGAADRMRIVGRGRDTTVVPSSQVRRWCSRDCLKRALYIQVQLHKAPAWQRPRGLVNKVEVLKERQGVLGSVNDKMRRLSLDDRAGEAKLREALTELAIERGDLVTGGGPSSMTTSTSAFSDNIVIREKPGADQSSYQSSSELASTTDTRQAMAVEGYTPKTANSASKAREDRDEDTNNGWNFS